MRIESGFSELPVNICSDDKVGFIPHQPVEIQVRFARPRIVPDSLDMGRPKGPELPSIGIVRTPMMDNRIPDISYPSSANWGYQACRDRESW